MTLEVPTESLCTVTEADAWHDARGNTAAWTALDRDRKEPLLRQAFDYLIGEFADQWPAGQTFGLLADDLVAPGARNACAYLALVAKDGPLDPEIGPQLVESTVGPITDKFAKREGDGRRRFPAVERLMAPHLADLAATVNPFSVKLVRS